MSEIAMMPAVEPAPEAGTAEADEVVPFEERVAWAAAELKRRGTPHRLRVILVEQGLSPTDAERIVAAARAQLLADSRQLGAGIAEWTVWILCGTLLIMMPLGGTIGVAGATLVLVGAMIVLGVAFLVWLSGVGEV